MRSFDYVITDALGIHARPAGLLAKEAKTFADTVIRVAKNGHAVKASQLLQLMGLGVKPGDTVTVTAEGVNEDAAITAMEAFFRENL